MSGLSEVQRLQGRFAEMRGDGWNVDSDLRWGYFFFDPDAADLRRLGDHLATEGFRVVEMQKTDDGDEYVLHIERVERHTPETLAKRNEDFRHLAAQFGVHLYDGWDVGKVG